MAKYKCETCGAPRTNDEANNCGERRPFLRFSNGFYQSYWPCKRCSSHSVVEVRQAG